MELQETIEIETPILHKKVVLRGYITGRIKQEVQAVMLSSVTEVSVEQATKFDGTAALAATNKALELIVLSVDGKSEGVLDAVLDLPEGDYDFIKAEVDKIQNPLVIKTSTN
ncbi:hypothetical protein QFZ36_000497 [Pseudarthrobacter siccitolerans]|uniref:Phage protein n=1 Tax=Pseudarthrobacter siccitolerans TaxID=861266 RepID=A0ABU0PI15_9MICC|nr:hypothetical protein [Pseudarthrobacter siccitolerans]MDQ0672936.1 hypothetical protein [Pseudarthrobacter siccitolerans]